MSARQRLAAGVTVLFLTTSSLAADATIQMFSSTFLPASVVIDQGETVTWEWIAGTHLLTSGIPGGTPGTPDEPGLLFEVTVDATQPSFSYTFDQLSATGGFSFHDVLNPFVIGFVEIDADQDTFIVNIVDNVFLPDEIAIFEFDSVRWQHEPGEMFHTITSGASSDPADDPGAVFDAVSSDANPIFVHEFIESGDQPYFCQPHESMGMTGLVIIQKRFIRGDANQDGSVELSDAIAILGHLFGGPELTCRDAADVNDDGGLDVADPIYLLGYSFAGGPPPASPFPNLGADRTADGLLCR